MLRQLLGSIVTALLCAVLVGGAAAAAPEFAFGGGRPGIGAFMPDLTAINGFASEAGFPPFEGDLPLLGGGGRGGLAPGLAFGGAGWGAWIESRSGDLIAEYGVGLGGFDVGFAVGGSRRAVLTVGMLLGGGGVELVLTQYPPTIEPFGLSPKAIVIEPTIQTYDSVFALVSPYVDMQIQLFEWMGLGIRAGYFWAPLEINWRDDGPLDPPTLAPAGLYVHFALVFGGVTYIGEDGADN